MIKLKNKLDIVSLFSQLNTTNVFKSKRKLYSDDILTFDIEVTSLFDIEGELKPFDYSKSKDYYIGRNKKALPYIWQFGYNDTVYYSRNFYDFITLLLTISNENIHQFIYVHNLAYEFHFLINLIKKMGWTIENLLARGLRKVIQFSIKELNITLRCSCALTNLSLQKSGEQFNTPHSKLVGELDYNIARSPLTPLSKEELGYCENDILVMYEFLRIYKEEYGHVKSIPITQTGEVRRDLNTRITYPYRQHIWRTVPNPTVMQMLMWAFMGGQVHANMIHSGKVIINMGSFDYSSRYPFTMAVSQFPDSQFFRIDEEEIDYFKKSCCLLYHVKFYNFKSKLYNNYIPSSKCVGKKGCRYDNGRIIKGDEIEMCITDIDFEIIRESYNIEKIEYIDIYASYKKYLPKEIILFLLEYYNNKTKLKGIESQEYLYMKSKQKINSSFGCAVTNPLKQNYILDLENKENIWKNGEFSEKFIEQKLEQMKESFSTIFSFATGCWITAISRKGLWDIIKETDKDTVYYDTDSDKIKDYKKYLPVIENINKENYRKIEEVCDFYGIDIELFSPTDTKGKKHTLGMLEFEGEYKEFKTLGGKKYCYRDEKNVLHMTLSGVRKSAVSQLNNDINNFKKGFEFDYSINKLNMIYLENQEPFTFLDCNNVEYTCNDIQFSIVAQPTTYTLGITQEYENLLQYLEEKDTIY